ncbi:hypothetical protein AOQ84DRAFT_273340, partial [Glonium stellatum]
GWVAEPGGRGTAGLLWSCLFTIFICTWSALHMNVPADNDSTMEIFLHKLRYMVIGVFTPELISMLAYSDLRDAHTIVTAVNREQVGSWTTTHGHLVVMGGLSVGSSDGRRMRLDGREFIRLITEKTLSMPIIDKLEIQDKSKADWVTKSIACAQIAWFVCRLISRAVQRLPVTTLELFTLTIVCCTVTTYVLWWQKPHDIRKPFVIK